tara:strand:- start:2373 stop:2894 length:522 start_codon:yes stop_codon:yes gene_type:complete
MTINSVENLVEDYPITPSFSMNNGIVMGISYEDSLIMKNYEPAPLCRIYFSSIENNICIDMIIDVVNQDYENVITINNSDLCTPNVSVEHYNGNQFLIYPNPANELVELKLELNKRSDVQFFISNILGQVMWEEKIHIKDFYKKMDISDYTDGIYLIRVKIDDTIFTHQLIVK